MKTDYEKITTILALRNIRYVVRVNDEGGTIIANGPRTRPERKCSEVTFTFDAGGQLTNLEGEAE
jgi:hypothetical protein